MSRREDRRNSAEQEIRFGGQFRKIPVVKSLAESWRGRERLRRHEDRVLREHRPSHNIASQIFGREREEAGTDESNLAT